MTKGKGKKLSSVQTFLQTCSAVQMRLCHPKLPGFSALCTITSLCQCDCLQIKQPRKLQRKTVRENIYFLYFPLNQLFDPVTVIYLFFKFLF